MCRIILRHHFFSVCLLARVVGGALCAGDDLEEVQWFPWLGMLPELAFLDDAHVIEAYATGQLVGLPADTDIAGLK